MKKHELIQALRDEEYLLDMSHEQQAQLPSHPAGLVDVRDEDLADVSGGTHTCTGSCTCTHDLTCFSAGFCCS